MQIYQKKTCDDIKSHNKHFDYVSHVTTSSLKAECLDFMENIWNVVYIGSEQIV